MAQSSSSFFNLPLELQIKIVEQLDIETYIIFENMCEMKNIFQIIYRKMFFQITDPSTTIYLKVGNPSFKYALRNAYNIIQHVFIKKNLIDGTIITICK